MLVKLGSYRFSPVPDRISLESAQQLVEIPCYRAPTVIQNMGTDPFRISIGGTIWRRDGGLAAALELYELMRQGEEVVFAIERLSWKVRISRCAPEPMRGGHATYSLDLIESTPAPIFVFTRTPDIQGPDIMDYWLQLAIAKARALDVLRIQQIILAKLNDAFSFVAKVKAALRDVLTLAELPQAILGTVATNLLLCSLVLQATQQHLKDLADTSYGSTAAAYQQILQLLFPALLQSDLLRARCQAMPPTTVVYRVQVQDTLQRIALKHYGSSDRWPDIAAANHIQDPTSLTTGQELQIPA